MTDWQKLLSDDERDLLKQAEIPQKAEPMLATLTHDHFSDPDWIYERKFDGERILAFRQGKEVRLLTRNDKSATSTYPELVDSLEEQGGHGFVADGEVVAFDGDVSSFSRLQKRMQIKSAEEARKSNVAVYYYLFDLVWLDGYILEELPLRTRKKILKQTLRFDERIRYTSHRNESGEAYYDEACRKGWEGIIAKAASSRYVHKRSKSWLKFKCAKGQELVIGGYTEPEGSRTGFGALLLGYYEDGEFRYAGRVGTGFDEDDLNRLHKLMNDLKISENPFDDDVAGTGVTWIKPELVAEIGFTEWTGSGKLRHPRFQGLRRDKSPNEVVREPQ